jgi:DNA-binding transcriptional LysR family regulator
MELRQLRYFVAVAEELNFNRAAHQLLIAQPALSQQIRKLEEEIGVSLFNREKRQIELTPAGQALLEDARKLLGGVEMAVRSCQRIGRGEKGRLIIGFTPLACWLLPRLIGQYREQYPEVELIFEELLNQEQAEALGKEYIDAAVALGRFRSEEPEVSQAQLYQTSALLALPASFQLATREGSGVVWQGLAGQSFIMFPRRYQPQLFDSFVNRCQQAGFSPKIVKEATQLETILNLVSAERGVALVPAYLEELVQWRGVVFRHLEEPTPSFEFYISWRKEDQSASLANFLRLILA